MTTSTANMEQMERAVRRRRIVRIVGIVLWAAVLAYAVMSALANPTPMTIATPVVLFVLFVVVYAQLLLVEWMGHRRFRKLASKLSGTGYISDRFDMPNRNYLLSEIRREMPRARGDNAPFTLVIFSLGDIAGVRERRGNAFADRAVNSLVELLRRVTRDSDFLAHLAGDEFAVLLSECTYEQAFIYLKRIPGTVAVSDGRRMLEVPVTARMKEYDMESLYATDVLHAVEESQPLRRKEAPRPGAVAA